MLRVLVVNLPVVRSIKNVGPPPIRQEIFPESSSTHFTLSRRESVSLAARIVTWFVFAKFSGLALPGV